MFCYHARIFDRERLPVASLSLLGDKNPSWRPDNFGYQIGDTDLRLRFGAVKLLDVDLALLEESHNPIALLALLHRDAQATRGQPEERMRRKIARFRTFLRKGYRAADLHHLIRFLDQLLRLDPMMNEQVRATMYHIEKEELGMTTFVTSFEELAAKEGEVRGIVKGQSALVLRQLERRFGPLPSEVQQGVAALSSDELLALGEALFDLASMDDVNAWLRMKG